MAFGFGINDGTNGADKVPTAPKFVGYQFNNPNINVSAFSGDPRFGIANLDLQSGYSITGSSSGEIGVQYGYYVNGGTATLVNGGKLFLRRPAPHRLRSDDHDHHQRVDRYRQPLHGSSPTISAYANLVFDFNTTLNVTFKFVGSTFHFPVNINFDQIFPLASFNAPLLDSNGKPMFNSDGTPEFDGAIKLFGTNILDPTVGLPALYSFLNAESSKVDGEVKTEEGEIEEGQAETPAEKAAAQTMISEGESESSAAKTSESTAEKNTKKGTTSIGDLITLGLGSPGRWTAWDRGNHRSRCRNTLRRRVGDDRDLGRHLAPGRPGLFTARSERRTARNDPVVRPDVDPVRQHTTTAIDDPNAGFRPIQCTGRHATLTGWTDMLHVGLAVDQSVSSVPDPTPGPTGEILNQPARTLNRRIL